MSGKYDKFRSELGNGNIDLINDDIRVILIDEADYTVNLTTHDFLDDVAAGARVSAATALASKTLSSAGVFDAADTDLSSVTGDPSEAVLIYKHTGTESTSPLISYHNGLTVTPNGEDITVRWNASGILKI